MKAHRIIENRFVLRNPFTFRGIWHYNVRDKLLHRVTKVSTHETRKNKAEEFILKWIKSRLSQETDQTNQIMFGKAYEEWLSLKTLRQSTQETYEFNFKGVLLPQFQNRYVSEITLADVETFLKNLSTRKISEHRIGLSPRTKNKYLFMLRSFFKWAKLRKYCKADPTEGIKILRLPKRFGIALEYPQARKLLEASRTGQIKSLKDYRGNEWKQGFNPPEHLFLSILIALHTGLRRGNITGLKWKRIDLEKRKITITADEMKSNADHEIPIHPELAEILTERLRKIGKLEPEALVIGKSIYSFPTSFSSALKKAELPKIRFHDLRHTFSTWLSTRTTYAIQKTLLGHSFGDVTWKYTHVPFEELKKAIDAMPRLLSGQQASGLNVAEK